jgi:hypothetical protein
MSQLPAIFSTAYIAATEGKSTNGTECAVCGKRCSKSKPVRHVAMSTGGDLLPLAQADDEDSQGLFPVGSTCAKAFPVDYLSEPRVIEAI